LFSQNLNQDLLLETEKLARSWAQHEAAWLRDYLVAGVEDPRLNLQSILSRHFLIRALAEDRFDFLMRHEYHLARDPDGRVATLYALRKRADNAEGLEIPQFVSQTFAALPAQAKGCLVPNYIEAFLTREDSTETQSSNGVLDTFSTIWNLALQPQFPVPEAQWGQAPPMAVAGSAPARLQIAPPLLSLLEPACGSANDYRFLDRFGIARFIDYTGFDLCQNNIENARALHPGVRFEPGNVFEISAPDKSFDVCLIHDLFEHLSLSGLRQAVEEVCRVTRFGLCVGFFQMDEIPDHIIRPLEDYHWNLLSLPRMRDLFASHGFAAQAVHIGSFLVHQIGCSHNHNHNPNAYTLFLTQPPDSGSMAQGVRWPFRE
jgi:SAM-dependent methyltransferase